MILRKLCERGSSILKGRKKNVPLDRISSLDLTANAFPEVARGKMVRGARERSVNLSFFNHIL